MKFAVWGFTWTVHLVLASGLPSASAESRFDQPLLLAGRVVYTSDGDTLHVKTEGGVVRVRISGIDAPERGQPYSRVARNALVEFVSGRDLSMACEKRDVYDRLICSVRVNGTDVGLTLISQGLAWHFKRFENEQSVEDRLAYSAAEDKARRERVGLFRQNWPMPPLECRQRRREGVSCEVQLHP